LAAQTTDASSGEDRYAVSFPLGGFLPDEPHGRSVREPAKDIPVLAECDVAVFGGGSSGVCAAVAAARAGQRVLLVERHGCLGGMATVAWVNVWHSLYGMDRKTRVIGGLVVESIRRLQRMGAVYNGREDQTGEWHFCAETCKLVFDDLAVSAGVKLLLHARLAGVLRDGRRITAALVETKAGRGAVLADTYIDCTGDADLVRFAGVPTQRGSPEGKCQAPTLVFRVRPRGPDAVSMRQVQRALHEGVMDYNGRKYSCFTWGSAGTWDPAEQMLAATRVLDVDASDPRQLTRAEVEARYQLRWVMDRLRTMPGWEDIHLVDVAAQLGIRETHRILADHTLTREEVLHGTAFDDGIAQGTYRIDIHTPDSPGILFEYLNGKTQYIDGAGEQRRGRWDGQGDDAPLRGTLCYHVPCRCLIPRELDNVLAAGRCIGADHAAAGAIRVMVNCMQFGQAAGTAAAMVGKGGGVRDVDASALRAELIAAGVPLRT
jgi:hypothetical protein